jgi:hypothetical protein
MTTRLPDINNVNASRPRTKGKPFPHYRPIRLSDADLKAINTIQVLSIKAQGKPKTAINFAQATRLAIHAHAARLSKEMGEAGYVESGD